MAEVPKQLAKYVFKKGQIANPKGRPKGKTMKEYAREYLLRMDDDDRIVFMNSLDPDLVWRMAEGNPPQDITSGGEKINPDPIYAGRSVKGHDSDSKAVSNEKKD